MEQDQAATEKADVFKNTETQGTGLDITLLSSREVDPLENCQWSHSSITHSSTATALEQFIH